MVSGFVGAADVDDDDIPDLQFAVRIPVMRVGAVRPGAHDDERHLRMPFGDNRFGDVGGDLGLGAPRHQELRHPGMHPVNGRTGLAQRVDLGRLLDHPQPAQYVGGQHRQHAELSGQRQQVQCRHGIGDRGRSRGAAQSGNHQLIRIVAVYPIPHRQAQFRNRRPPQRRQLQPRHHDRRRTGGRQHQRGESLERVRARTDQIAQVVARGDHQAGKPSLRGRHSRRAKPAGIHGGVE